MIETHIKQKKRGGSHEKSAPSTCCIPVKQGGGDDARLEVPDRDLQVPTFLASSAPLSEPVRGRPPGYPTTTQHVRLAWTMMNTSMVKMAVRNIIANLLK